jgi:AraC-like DNA-binding protein
MRAEAPAGTPNDRGGGTAPVNEAVSAVPRGPLQRFVVAHHGYRQRNVAAADHLGVPSPFLTVIFTLSEPVYVARHVDQRNPPAAYRTLAGGLHTSPALIRHDGAQSGIQLAMSPLAARALFGMPAGELSGLDVDAADVLGPLADRVQEQLAGSDRWAARFALLDAALGAHLDLERAAPAPVRQAWALLCRSGGSISVRALAREVGWGERHLAARFRTEVGLTPKSAARVIRFHNARRDLQQSAQAGRRPHLAEIAAARGYFDHSHLVRDFVEFTGLAPTAWLDAEVGNLQVGAPDEARDLAP